MPAKTELTRETAQAARLQTMLPQWLERVPLYHRAGYPPEALRKDFGVAKALRKLPFITKRDLRENFPHNFLGPEAKLDPDEGNDLIEVEHTSGTNEERTALLLGRGWWAEQERTALRLNAVTAKVVAEHPDARRCTINSPVCNNDISYVNPPTHDERIVGHSLSLGLSRHPFLWSEDELARMAEEAVDWQPLFLDVDPVYGVVFALYCERHGIRLPTLQFILTSYEYTSVVHRRIMERVFQVPVFNLYGATETGHLLMEDETGRMAPALETAFLEVVETDDRGIGSLVVTTLTNEYMPLIRYRVGDLAEAHAQPHGTDYILHGREKDAFRLPDGSRVTTRDIDQHFTDVNGIAHYQLLQGANDEWRLRFVPEGRGPSEGESSRLRERLLAQLKISDGLALEPVDLVLPEGSGKFRLGYPVTLQK
jgi:phenylacetate-CoA ligase